MEQYIIVGLIVAGCAAYILRKFIFKPKNSSICNGCDRCGGRKPKSGCH
ncbi:FeoB-associated Cys-rich membrane protein [Neisseria chenwenguii]|uniref:FeoB-associated Cys-rich membrane protein n=1 Tax=Neisseria chenwenguii TaxID=1853278 RepID=A0A220S055_9NEIS|nr:FeoB-associated Cys-rich membrane protein [Neisseria chenwenguii]ASK26768.1 FeoB-associated Cys-rich membrane protein [Neisseria chenwenguii]ROV56431.1 FeoB-associated Cys-rich membrane protein [Neisseria chenwenguii]